MKILLKKSTGRVKCRNRNCKKNDKYINEKGRIRRDTTCIGITMDSGAGSNTSYYCRECIDEIYLDMKKCLNPNLWIFT